MHRRRDRPTGPGCGRHPFGMKFGSCSVEPAAARHCEPRDLGDRARAYRVVVPTGERRRSRQGAQGRRVESVVARPVREPLEVRLAEVSDAEPAPDLRGFGESTAPSTTADYKINMFVSDLLRILDALGVSTVRLVGHDWGAAVGWQTCMQHADRIDCDHFVEPRYKLGNVRETHMLKPVAS